MFPLLLHYICGDWDRLKADKQNNSHTLMSEAIEKPDEIIIKGNTCHPSLYLNIYLHIYLCLGGCF